MPQPVLREGDRKWLPCPQCRGIMMNAPGTSHGSDSASLRLPAWPKPAAERRETLAPARCAVFRRGRRRYTTYRAPGRRPRAHRTSRARSRVRGAAAQHERIELNRLAVRREGDRADQPVVPETIARVDREAPAPFEEHGPQLGARPVSHRHVELRGPSGQLRDALQFVRLGRRDAHGQLQRPHANSSSVNAVAWTSCRRLF